jgi:agarase
MKSKLLTLTLVALFPAAPATIIAAETNPYFGLSSITAQPTGFFRLAQTGGRHHLVTPDGRPYLALGINHLDMLQGQPIKGGLSVRGDAAFRDYWVQTLRPQFADWNLTTLGYGAPASLRTQAPWFATITLAAIEKHRSDPKRNTPDGYYFPDVFDPVWVNDVAERIVNAAAPLRNDPFLIGYFWTDTPTWDLVKTRALRGTDWVSALRTLPPTAPGRQAYADFLGKRYANRLGDLNHIYGLDLTAPEQLREADLNSIAVGRHVVQEDDEAFLAQIARRFYEVAGRAQREADPNHLVFGDRYLAGDAPESVLEAAKPYIDAVAVQPGDRYTSLYPASTQFPEDDMDLLHTVAGKPVLICDHAISFPTADHPRTIFEQMPDEATAARATADFLQAAFAKPWMIGYLRCQYIDRPAGYGRGLRQGVVRGDGTPRESLVRVYREGFAAALKNLQALTP